MGNDKHHLQLWDADCFITHSILRNMHQQNLNENALFCLKWHLMKQCGSRKFKHFLLLNQPFTLTALLQAFNQKTKTFEQQWHALDQCITPLMELAHSLSIQPITFDHPCYPSLLKHTADPPPLLWCKGHPKSLIQDQLAVVGSRKPSPLAKINTAVFTEQLSQAGLSICSGLAIGIDTIAHESALRQSGQTVAVLGTGLDLIYPKKNVALAETIIENGGCLISELPLGTPPKPTNFPARNRIISGISKGTLITEATLRSGSLVTARYALEQNRDIFAIPASIQSHHGEGCNWLIKQGAYLVTQASEILEHMSLMPTALPIASKPELTSDPLLALMQFDIWHFDDLLTQSTLSITELKAQLLRLEIQRRVEKMPAAHWQRLV